MPKKAVKEEYSERLDRIEQALIELLEASEEGKVILRDIRFDTRTLLNIETDGAYSNTIRN